MDTLTNKMFSSVSAECSAKLSIATSGSCCACELYTTCSPRIIRTLLIRSILIPFVVLLRIFQSLFSTNEAGLVLMRCHDYVTSCCLSYRSQSSVTVTMTYYLTLLERTYLLTLSEFSCDAFIKKITCKLYQNKKLCFFLFNEI